MKELAKELQLIVSDMEPKLKLMDADEVVLKPYPEKWSKKEILGHLIDSAANNHQRLVRSQYEDVNNFPVYAQNEWVQIQKYDEIDWQSLVGFWTDYNMHLARLIDNFPSQSESVLCNVGKNEPVTLKIVVEDYIRHLRHHLEDILHS
jgi:hypothetical protein